MSRRWRFTPTSRSLPAEAMSRFCVLRRTPSPALEMYSRPRQSRVIAPCRRSRNDWAVGDWAESRRPAIATTPGGPFSIVSMSVSRRAAGVGRPLHHLAEGDPGLAQLFPVFVFEGIDHPSHQVDSQPAGLALFNRQVDVRVGDLRDVERPGVMVDQRRLDAPRNSHPRGANPGLARPALFHHVADPPFHPRPY